MLIDNKILSLFLKADDENIYLKSPLTDHVQLFHKFWCDKIKHLQVYSLLCQKKYSVERWEYLSSLKIIRKINLN